MWSRALETTAVSPVLLLLILNRLDDIQGLTSCRQLTSDCVGELGGQFDAEIKQCVISI